MILYTNLMPTRFAGFNLGPITLIRPSHKDDTGLHIHESVHREQFYRNPFMGGLYFFSAKHRQAYEVEAFKAQLKFEPRKLQECAGLLSTNYGLKLSAIEAAKLLGGPNDPTQV